MLDDKISAAESVDIGYLDRGTFFGDGVYEVVRTAGGRIFGLEYRMQRFAHSLAELRINGIDIEEIDSRVKTAYKKSSLADAVIYWHITRGCGPRSHTWNDSIRPRFYLQITPLKDASQKKQHGVDVMSLPDIRWKRCDIKSLNLLPNVLAVQAAKEKNCEEPILVDENGCITEGASAAFFAVINGVLRTAPLTTNVLPSITRCFVLHIAEHIGIEVDQTAVSLEEAYNADELMISASTRDVLPVVKFDDKIIAAGRPGEYTMKIMAEFEKFINGKTTLPWPKLVFRNKNEFNVPQALIK